MNVFELLKQGHERVRRLFSELAKTQGRQKQARQDLFHQLKRELLAHSHAEERVFYPKLVDQPPAHDIIEDGINEHHQVEKLLHRIEGMPVETEEWMSAVTDLDQMFEHHTREEEARVFPKARQLLRDDQFEPIGTQVEQVENEERRRTPY